MGTTWLRAQVVPMPPQDATGGPVVAVSGKRTGRADPVAVGAVSGRPVPAHESLVAGGTSLVGRQAESARLAEALAAGSAVVVGPAGVGKSALVEEWVARHRSELRRVWWIDARDEEAVDRGLIRLAHAVGGEEVAGQDLAMIRSLASEWLRRNHGWLLVLDGATHPIHLQGLLSRYPNGRFAVTSRSAGPWPARCTEVPVVPLEPRGSALLAGLGGLDEGRADPGLFGGLPPAARVAGGVLSQVPDAAERLFELASQAFGTPGSGGDEGALARFIRAAVWEGPTPVLDDSAAVLLDALCRLAAGEVPLELIGGCGSPPAQVSSQLAALADLGLLTPRGDAVGIDTSVWRAVRERGEHGGEGWRMAGRMLATAFGRGGIARRDALWLYRVLPHVDAWAEQSAAGSPEWGGLFAEVAAALSDAGDFARAVAFQRGALERLVHRHGASHPHTLAARNDLGCMLIAMGSPEHAIPVLAENLAAGSSTWDEADPHVALAVRNLACALVQVVFEISTFGNLGDDALDLAARYRLRAIALLTEDLARMRQRRDADDIERWATQDCLATAYLVRHARDHGNQQGDLEKAEQLFTDSYQGRARRFGEHSTEALLSRLALGGALTYPLDKDAWSRAALLLDASYADLSRLLGEHSSDALRAAQHRAEHLSTHGDLMAVVEARRYLETCRELFGIEHPRTLHAYRLAIDTADDSPFDEACRELLAQREADCLLILGDVAGQERYPVDHLSFALLVAGDVVGAARLLRRPTAHLPGRTREPAGDWAWPGLEDVIRRCGTPSDPTRQGEWPRVLVRRASGHLTSAREHMSSIQKVL